MSFEELYQNQMKKFELEKAKKKKKTTKRIENIEIDENKISSDKLRTIYSILFNKSIRKSNKEIKEIIIKKLRGENNAN